MAFLEAKQNEGNLSLGWYFVENIDSRQDKFKLYSDAVIFFWVIKNSSNMLSWCVIMGILCQTGMPHRIAQQPTV